MAQKIIVAAGVEIRDYQGAALIRYLNDKADAGSKSTWTFPKGVGANAKYEVQLVFTATEFATALDTAGAYVIYEGHSRYGQGPAFGPAKTPHVPDKKAFSVNPWGVHFRMGYDATDTEAVEDLVEHSVTPAEYDLPRAPKSAFLPLSLERAAARAKSVEREVRRGKLRRTRKCVIPGAWRTFKTCVPTLDAVKTARGDEPLKDRHYYARLPERLKGKTPPDEFLTAVQVGSTDLDKVSLKCALLFMASCSSKVHFLRPLGKRRKETKSACKFYLTGSICGTYHGRNFVKQVFEGIDPTSRDGGKLMLEALNGELNSGMVGIY